MTLRTKYIAVLAALLVTAFSFGVMASTDGVHEATYVATANGYEGPDSLVAGTNVIHLVNQRQDLVHLQLLRLVDGRTLDDLFALFQTEPEVLPRWIEFVGGPTLAIPGGASSAGSFLAPGEYIATSFLADPNGVPHAAAGLVKVIQVVAPQPEATLSIALHDYRFDVEGTFTQGAQTVAVRNEGRQPHEVVVIQLAPGASAMDFLHSLEHGGPPLGMPAGGIQGLNGGMSGFFSLDLAPGNYALLCLIPDQGVPHFAHGMILEFEIE